MTDPSPVLPDSTLREQVEQVVFMALYEAGVNFVSAVVVPNVAKELLPLFAVVSAEAEKRGAAKALTEAADEFDADSYAHVEQTILVEGRFQTTSQWLRHRAVNPYIPEPEKGQNT